MAKNFPYFKFISTEWMTGDIVYESLAVQGLFINICALYWQRNGELSLEDINKRYKAPEELKELTDRFFSVNDGLVSIKFLDEQLEEANHISKTNSENGKKGGRPKALETEGKKPTALRNESEKKQIRIKEEKELNKSKEELNNNLPNFFYIGNKIFRMPLSVWLNENKKITLEAWCQQNESNINEVYAEIDKDVGKMLTDEKHALNFFKSTAKLITEKKNKVKPTQSTNFNQAKDYKL